MKILHVIRDLSPETGGPVTAVRGLSVRQREIGHQVSVVSTNFGLPLDGSGCGWQYETCSCTIGPWRYAPGMADLVAKKMDWCDLVHVHMVWEYPTLLAVKLARKMDKPFVLRPCGMLDEWSMSQSRIKKSIYLALFAKALFSPPCLLHFTTHAEREKSIVPFNPQSVVIENGIPDDAMSEASPDAFLDCFPELRGKQIVLFLGRVHPKKRADIAIQAFSRVAARFPNAVLVVAGPCAADYRHELMRLAKDTDVGARIHFTGMLGGSALYGAYRAASLFLLPSMQENFGIAVAEAMAASCPVVISRNVDLKSYILAAGAGIVCETDPEQFAYAIDLLLRKPQLAISMGKKGKSVTEEYFTWSRAAERLDKVYRELTG